MNLFETLLRFSHGEEDPLTEILAWFLRTSPELREEVLESVDLLLRRSSAGLPRTAARIDEPVVRTQVVAANARGTACRYDLVCDWHAPRVSVIVEVKVWAGLTWGVATGADGSEAMPAHQVARYLAVAAGADGVRTHVIVLAPYAVDLGFDGGAPSGFAGQLTWQAIHDGFSRTLARGDLPHDPTLATLTRNFVHLLETKRMAAPKLTFDVLTSVSRYRQFEKSARMMLTHARDTLVGDGGALRKFWKGNASAWQDGDHDRIGWRVWADPKDIDSFAFVGIHLGPGTIHEEVPDLYFFVQTKKGSAAHKQIESRAGEVSSALQAMATSDPSLRVRVGHGGWEVYAIRKSLVEVARTDDPTDATIRFFRDCVSSDGGKRLLSIYLDVLGVQAGA